LPSHVDRLLRWLPQDTETVIVTQGQFTLRMDDRPESKLRRFPLSAYQLVMIPRSELWEELRSATILVVVSGCRGFATPTDADTRVFEGCDVLQYEAKSSASVERAFKACLRAADRIDEIAGQEVGVFKVQVGVVGNDHWEFFLANPEPTILVCATDRSYLKRVLNRKDRNADGRALPMSLPEWQHVDLKAPVWAVRHYSKDVARRDPTSPLGPQSKVNVADPHAVGLVFWYDDRPEAVTSMTVRYISNAPDNMGIVVQGWKREKEGLTPKIVQVAPNVVEVSLANGGGDDWKPFLRNLCTYCGKTVLQID